MAAPASRTTCRTLLRTSKRSFTRSTRASSSSSSSSTPSTSSSSSSSSWQPLLKPGVLPAYDEALSYLSSQSAALRSRIASLEQTHPDLPASELAQLRESLEIAARINDPATLAAFQSSSATHYDASNPAFRHLRERLWRKDSGVLAKVIERCTLMHVLPDVLPGITPTADVQLAFGQGEGFTDHASTGGDVLVGVFVDPSVTLEPPTVEVNVFHTETKRYTLAIVDPDQPDEEAQTFRTSLLALKTDIELSATSDPKVDLTHGMQVAYVPPHPQQGTKYHRYTTVLFEQPQQASEAQAVHDRHNFSVADFAQSRGLVPAGIHFWRAQWSPECAPTVSKIYTDILKTREPKYTKPPTLDKVRKQIGDIGSKWFS
ncbi:related to MRPL35-mitochondrial ribosomal protein, large subunit [Sporisorium reilianum f. sp. reilianum]|uniref:Related to MRPL35-mitochondrial ribosomal protein, large subunit n=1 Tax=Sporisorium reilianum f. sp. reilianum TaxID=72559 RepID=A0A2N8UF05_9BASI|nr:related to MRPL35-mitochondrial ribosomal protein, large subunit [Sporisorium reilianum f. sp. reilianum]